MFKQWLMRLLGYKYAISLCGYTKLLTTHPYKCDYITLLFKCDLLLENEINVDVDFDKVMENIKNGVYTDFIFTKLSY